MKVVFRLLYATIGMINNRGLWWSWLRYQ